MAGSMLLHRMRLLLTSLLLTSLLLAPASAPASAPAAVVIDSGLPVRSAAVVGTTTACLAVAWSEKLGRAAGMPRERHQIGQGTVSAPLSYRTVC